MVQLQLLNKILADKTLDILQNNHITDDYFFEYPNEIEFIKTHYMQYGKVPDTETFLSNFEDFDVLQVEESDRYLVDTIREEYLYYKSVPVIKKAAELLKTDANEFSRYLQSELVTLTPNYSVKGVDIIHDDSRIKEFEDKSKNKDKWYITTGFPELDDIIYGWQQGEEFVVVVARTGQGKSWIVVKFAQHAWEIGKNVGYISPEMSANKIGYRFDTYNGNFSNKSLTRGFTDDVSVEQYVTYFKKLEERENKFIVATPRDFGNKVTVSKLRSFIIENKLEILVVDGITYLSDERYKKGDNKTTTLTNISEDLMSLSCELKIPIIVVVQSNREGIKEGESDAPELENIRDSDGISHNSTKVLSLKQKEEGLVLSVKKNRDGRVGDKLMYYWDIDKGVFIYEPKDNKVSDYREDTSVSEVVKPTKKQGKVAF